MNLPAIEAFLASAFNEAELRRLVAHLPEDGELLGHAVLGQGAPLAELAHQIVALLRRHRRLDAEFFDRLRELRPQRAGEIDALEAGAPRGQGGKSASGASRPVLISGAASAQPAARSGKSATVHGLDARDGSTINVSIDQSTTSASGRHVLLTVAGVCSLGLGLTFLTNIAGAQDSLCRMNGARSACAALGLGHLPSAEEEAAWARASTGTDCAAFDHYLKSWPDGDYARLAQIRWDTRRVATATTWHPDEIPIELTVRGSTLFDDEVDARHDAQQLASAMATQLCNGLNHVPGYRVLGASTSVEQWICTQIGLRWRCSIDGQALCQVEIGKSVETETCGAAGAGP